MFLEPLLSNDQFFSNIAGTFAGKAEQEAFSFCASDFEELVSIFKTLSEWDKKRQKREKGDI